MGVAALFDLDGTLVDSAPDIHAAASSMLRDLSLPPLPFAEAREYIGDGMARFVKRVVTRQWWGEPEESLLAAATGRMQFHYARECAGGRVYDGVIDTLAALKKRGARLGCVTNKPHQFTLPMLDACALGEFFDTVISGDSLPTKKPDPAPLQEACRRLSVRCETTWMVGDSCADSRAAAAAGCRFAVVSYGYHRDGRLPPAEKIVYNFPEVLYVIVGENQCL